MSTKRLCCAMPDGSVRILSYSPEMFNPQSGTRVLLAEKGKLSLSATEQDVLAFIRAKDAPKDAVTVTVHDVSELPQDRTFRNAWTHDGVNMSVNMPKARTIHLDRIRAVRKSALERLDADWMKATGQGRVADAATIESQRQVLRDLPQTLPVDQCTTPDELKALWPAELPRR